MIEGFTLGIALIIFLQQAPAPLGTRAGTSSNAVVAAVEATSSSRTSTAAWSLAAVALVAAAMILAPRLHPQLPGSIIGIVAVTLVAALAALVAIESLLSARVAASISDTGPYNADRELVGQGLASIASGFFGGMPATGAVARTAVNVRAGARSRVAAIIHSLVLVAVVYLAATAVARIPLAALAGVLMVTAARMVSVATVRSLVGSTRPDAAVFRLTAAVTASFDLIIAVGIGTAAAALFAVRALAKSSGVHRKELPGHSQPGDERIALFRLEGALFFGVAERVLDRVNAIDGVQVVILRMSQLQILDATGARVITEMIEGLERRGVTVLVKGVQSRHLRLVTQVGAVDALRGQRHLFDDLDDAVAHARSHVVSAPVAPS